nr:hypothetical protein [Clostridioides sp.]
MNFISYVIYCIKKREKPSLKHYVECVEVIENAKSELKEWI